MSEQENLVSQGGEIELHQIPLIVEQIFSDLKETSLRKDPSGLEEEVAAARRKTGEAEPLFVLSDYRSRSKEGFRLVPLNKIIGTVSPSFPIWGHEYSGRGGRHYDIISELLEAAEKGDFESKKEAVNHTFHLDDGRPDERIRLVEFQGPAGPIYFAVDGTHRVSVSKVLGLKEIPGEVETGEIQEAHSLEPYDKEWWESLIKTGLVQGKIEERELALSANTKKRLFTLRVEKSVLPWVDKSFNNFFRFNKRYNEIYSGAFSNIRSLLDESLTIPENVFLNPIEFNRFSTNASMVEQTPSD